MRLAKLLIISIVLLFFGTLQAQVSINFQFGTPPSWGPTGYSEARYYYLPDIEAYYDVQSSVFICFNGSKWIKRSHLPYRYRNYDLYGGYKVVMSDYHGNTPYSHFADHRSKYAKGYRDHHQQTFKEKSENRREDKFKTESRERNNQRDNERGKSENKKENKGKGHGHK
ncbi:MAG: hypothetical protein PHV20_01700 [Bacteroidales bacterium]|nr:hypothetical protein [Bacteroidales bacterium]